VSNRRLDGFLAADVRGAVHLHEDQADRCEGNHRRDRGSQMNLLAVNDLGFRTVQFQATDCEASLKIGLEGLHFLLGPAVNKPVIRVPTPRKVWVRPRHPEVERVVQKKI